MRQIIPFVTTLLGLIQFLEHMKDFQMRLHDYQDLLEIAPDAVIMNEEDGYYRVDYSKIDVDFHKL